MLRKRVILAALLSAVAALASLAVVSNISVQNEIDHSLEQSLELATVAANYVDYLLQNNLGRLYDVSLSGVVDFEDGDWTPEFKALETAYRYSIFSDGLFMLDSGGKVVLSYPRAQVSPRDFSGLEDVQSALRSAGPFYTSIRALKDTQRRTLFAFAPLKDKLGKPVGVVGGEIDPTGHLLRNSVRAVPSRSDIVIEVVDDSGVVIASSNPDRVFTCSDRSRFLNRLISRRDRAVFQCHRCHQEESGPAQPIATDVLAFAPLQEAPWGVAVREPQSNIFAPSEQLRRRFLLLGLIIVACAVVLAGALGKSVVSPIQTLTAASQRIAGGNLAEPVSFVSGDEIGTLASSFDAMRRKLAHSLRSLRKANDELEQRIAERTRQLEESKQRLASLLHQVMRAQEDERKRIARELHDETTQSAAALGLSIEVASMALREGRLQPDDLLKLKASVEHLIDGINGLIRDLRPPMLDDLGLVSAVRWLLARHLSGKGVRASVTASQDVERLLDQARRSSRFEGFELILFRILQEAVVNVSKHAKASNASVTLDIVEGALQMVVKDDGEGFDAAQTLRAGGRDGASGYGLMGLRERATLLGGQLTIQSQPGRGTQLCVVVPFELHRRETCPSES